MFALLLLGAGHGRGTKPFSCPYLSVECLLKPFYGMLMLWSDIILSMSFSFPSLNRSFIIDVLSNIFTSLQPLLPKSFIFIQESYSLIEVELKDLLLFVLPWIFSSRMFL